MCDGWVRFAVSELVVARECGKCLDDRFVELSNGTSSWGGRTPIYLLVCDPTTLEVRAVGGLWLG